LNRCELRKEVYKYIIEMLRKFPDISNNVALGTSVTLDDLIMLKEGVTDPSPALVEALKLLLKGVVTELEIDKHLVTPFEK